ncbi:hypothetical protein ABTX77_36875 [Streptomyces sp. NPDC097704]|uniref:hypothetical protein n=1 Tax=Streptomyces sp. NPDC097704 TaxID=3157101 RepID=UPI00331679BB
MTRRSANTALDSLRDLFALSEPDRPGQHVFRPSGLMIGIHCMRDMFEADDEPEEEQGYYFSSVLLARPGYYDTPAQAAERLQQSL